MTPSDICPEGVHRHTSTMALYLQAEPPSQTPAVRLQQQRPVPVILVCRLSLRATRQLYACSSDILCPYKDTECSYIIDMEPFDKVGGSADLWTGGVLQLHHRHGAV